MNHLITFLIWVFLLTLMSCNSDVEAPITDNTEENVYVSTENLTYVFNGEEYTITFDAITLAMDSESQTVLDELEALTAGLTIQPIRKVSNPNKVYLYTPESAADAFGFNPYEIDFDDLPTEANTSISSRALADALRFYEHIWFNGDDFSGTPSSSGNTWNFCETMWGNRDLRNEPMQGGGNWNDEISSWRVRANEIPNLNAQRCDDYLFLFLFLDIVPGASWNNCKSDLWLIDLFNVDVPDLTKQRWCPWPFGPGNMNDDISSYFLLHLPRGCDISVINYDDAPNWDNAPCTIFQR